MKSKDRVIFVIDPHLSSSTGIRKDDIIETNLNKWAQLFQLAKLHNADIFTTGDLTDQTSLDNELMIKIIDLFKENKETNVFTIWGNHDEYQDNKLLRIKTSMKLLLTSCDNLIEYPSLSKDSEILAVDFVDSEKIDNFLDEIEASGVNTPIQKVMVTHTFFNNSFMGGQKDNLTVEQAERLEKLGVKHLICGHDHEPHPPIEIDGLVVHRFGNLIRKNRKKYNMHRQIEVMLYDLTMNQYMMLDIEHKPFLDVIRTEKLLEAREEVVETEKIRELMENFKGETTEEKFEEFLNKKIEEEKPEVAKLIRQHI